MQLVECYRILGLPRNASLEDVKAAYRRLARKYHPDVNRQDPNTTEKFHRIQEAYRVLKDAAAGISPPPPPPRSSAPPPPKPSPPRSPDPGVQRRDVRAHTDPIANDPETKLRLDMVRRVQELLKQKKYLVAIAIAEGMRARFPKATEVAHWQAVAYYRHASALIQSGKFREAEPFLHKATAADPSNRELQFEVKRDLERVRHAVGTSTSEGQR